MAIQSRGLQRLKRHITVDAPVESCFQSWQDSAKMPEFMSRLIGVQVGAKPARLISTLADMETIAPFLERSPTSYGKIKHWLISGPGGKLYEFENLVVLEIPNRFYCTTSIDPQDISVQSSLFFCPDGKNEHTFIEWEISFWCLDENGSGTKLLCDILATEDPAFEQCLQDFKTHMEEVPSNGNGRPHKK